MDIDCKHFSVALSKRVKGQQKKRNKRDEDKTGANYISC